MSHAVAIDRTIETTHPRAPRAFHDWRGRHAGETIVVCGCGRSLGELPEPQRWTTIGVNDVGRLFDPTYLVVLNPKHQFSGDRFRHVVESRARALFTQLDLRASGVTHPATVQFRLGRRGGTDLTTDALPYTRNSPYVAVCLAAFMGARRIGLVGVDFNDHHFFASTGAHALTRELATIDREYGALAAALARDGIELINLSGASRLTSLRKQEPVSFLSHAPAATEPDRPIEEPATRALSIVSYATTPVAGVPPILARCITARTPHRARCVWASHSYGNGVTFDGDLEWTRDARGAEAALAAADVVIVHNGKVDPRHAALLADRPVVTMAHNYLWNVDARFVSHGFPGVVVGQYQATLPEFAGWQAVPNPVPLWEEPSTPGEKGDVPAICYTPSGRHERYPEGHRLYWHGKGYDTTMRVLERLAAQHGVRLEVIRDRQLSHAEVLAMKRRAHIVIDECVTGSYHRNTLEGLAAGCVVVNGVGLLPAVTEVFKRCALDAEQLPCILSGLDDLEQTLTRLIARGAAALEHDGRANRAWMERHWDFAAQWARYWWPAVTAAVARARPRRSAPAASLRRTPVMRAVRQRPRVSNPRHTISVVVPHGGGDRLRHLATILASLRQRDAVMEIVVSEMGEAPVAREIADRWADKYVFTRSGEAFDRARMLNVGSGLAEGDLVLWHDNDLLMDNVVIARAARELNDRRLDYLIPYSSVRYLSETESLEVMSGSRATWECRPVSELYSSRRFPACSGGAGLVRRDFLLRYGGLVEGFRGWGGEDNAWNRKVALLGRSAATARPDQQIYHLFHPSSAGYPGRSAGADNPHYAHNVALLRRIAAIRDPREFLRQFPPPPHRPRPWAATRRIMLLAGEGADHAQATAIAQALQGGYGASVDPAPLLANDGWCDRAAAADALVVVGAAAGDDRSRDLESQIGRPVPTLRVAAMPPDPMTAATALVGPLSVVLGGATLAERWPARASVVPDLDAVASRDSVPSPQMTAAPAAKDPIPVWTYWEGPCPAWVERCRATIAAHGRDVRHLDPAAFAALRDRDRDIDLSGLGPAQRADFVRAFLLARVGGLWVDADCIVMQPLDGVLNLVREHEFIAHRERSGLVSNGFVGARPGSAIAAAFYETLCRILRSRRPLGWTSLGSEPLTQLLTTRAGAWHELRCEQVQPICWSRPEAFLARGPRSQHEGQLDRGAWCYMMSNTEISKRPGAAQALTEGDSFFTYLVDASLATQAEPTDEQVFTSFVAAYRRYGDESLSGPGSTLAQTVAIRERLPLLLEHLGVRSLLDAPCGDFNWMRQVRLGVESYLGVDMLPDLIAENERLYSRPSRKFRRVDLRADGLPRMDAILCRDCLVHLSFADALAVLRNFRRSGARFLLATTFPSRRAHADTSRCEWRPLNLELPPFNFPPPLRIIDEQCTEAGGAYRDKAIGVWRLADVCREG